MKKLTTLMFLFISLSLYGYSNKIVTIENQKNEMVSLLSVLEIPNNTTFEIVFSISSNNTITIENVICTDDNVKYSVLKSLDNKHINGNNILVEHIHLKFIFKDIKEQFTVY